MTEKESVWVSFWCGGLDRLLQNWGSLETNGLACLDLDRLAGSRIERLARLCLANREGAETGECELPGLLHFLDDGVNQFIGSTVRGGAGNLRCLLEDLRDKG